MRAAGRAAGVGQRLVIPGIPESGSVFCIHSSCQRCDLVQSFGVRRPGDAVASLSACWPQSMERTHVSIVGWHATISSRVRTVQRLHVIVPDLLLVA